MDYDTFLKSKRLVVKSVGQHVRLEDMHPSLFPFQKALVQWACRKGRAATFADTGLGKTRQQLEAARLLGQPAIILAPLAVVKQTIREGERIGVRAVYSNTGEAAGEITITNYEQAHKFDPAQFGTVILDESSILKSLHGAIKDSVTEQFKHTHYRLCYTATPAPNDIVELGQHAEFLGILTRQDMLSTFFVHSKDLNRGGASSTDGWTLKSHARAPFFRWLASWGMSVRQPSDIGDFDDTPYQLPPLEYIQHYVDYEFIPDGQMFSANLNGVGDYAKVRRNTIDFRVAQAAELVNNSDEAWIVWCGLNDESDALVRAIPDAKSITGNMSAEQKAELIDDFQQDKYRVMVTKSSIAGMGINLQNVHNQLFCGMNYSYEQFYQSYRRSHRFGQQYPVKLHIVVSKAESGILQTVKRKQKEAERMADELISAVKEGQLEELGTAEVNKFVYAEDTFSNEKYTLMLGDSCKRLAELDSESVDFSVFSPPFSAIYAYSPTEQDLANSRGMAEFFAHFNFIITELFRVMKPGRNIAVHLMQLPATKTYHGFTGMIDFHGEIVRAFTQAGFHFYGEAYIQKNPQVQAIRTKKLSLLFKTLKKDSTQLAPGIPDCLVIFKKPGENAVPVTPIDNGEMDENDWIAWAHPIWTDVRETETLNVAVAKENPDEKHVSALQLEVIRRAVIMYTNPGELVLDPFGGVGSTGYVAVQNKRRATMIELKPSYYRVMINNMHNAVVAQPSLFDWMESTEA